MLTFYAQKLFNYLGMYQITSQQYKAHLLKHPHTNAHGIFAAALDELYFYGY